MVKYNIKANRIFTKWRKIAWLGTFVIAVGGLFEPLLGLFVVAIIVGLMVMSFLRGRYWCGNICMHGSFYDLILIKFSRNEKIPNFLRSNFMVVFFLAFFMFNMGRGMINAFTAESLLRPRTLFVFRLIEIDVTDTVGVLRGVGFVFVNTYWMVLVISVCLGLIFTSRAWCQFCPMGTFQRLSYRLSKIIGTSKKTDVMVSAKSKLLCHSCAKCTRVCPMQLHPYLEFDSNSQLKSDKCIKCKTCIKNCPAHILSLQNEENATKITQQTEHSYALKKPEHRANIEKINKIDKNILEIAFKIKNSTVDFIPGQFILVNIKNNPKMNRAYSISGFEKEKDLLRVTVKKAPGGYGSDIVFNSLKEGDEVILEGPLGHELTVDKTSKNILLVAGGIGVTPFIPILEDLSTDVGFNGNVHFIYGVNKENELLYLDDIKSLTNRRDNFKFTPVVAFDDNYKGEKGFVTTVIEKLSLSDTKIYMCGPKPMVDSSEKLLGKMNFDRRNLFVESA
ncbi:MAG: 4Fe-4S binding protein [Defluviitaleaceae bacterium]|nr:4Fe-4S binding protein [Defluviitaleaceae bacterium]